MTHTENAGVNDALEQDWEKIKRTVAWSVRDALIKRGRLADLQETAEETRKELEDEVLQKVLKAVYFHWSPTGGASPATFVSMTAHFAALKAVDALALRQNRFGASLDAPAKPNAVSEDEAQTFADITSDADAASGILAGEEKICAAVDLEFIRSMLSADDWAIFIRRYERRISNRQLAAELGWTEDKLRWYLKGYEKRLSKLLAVKRPVRR